jgi:hypothetical protein
MIDQEDSGIIIRHKRVKEGMSMTDGSPNRLSVHRETARTALQQVQRRPAWSVWSIYFEHEPVEEITHSHPFPLLKTQS